MKNKLISELKHIEGKKIFLRLDLNVPIQDGKILSSERIVKSLPTIEFLLKEKARLVIVTHIGRPKNGYDEKLSTKILWPFLEQSLGAKIEFCENLADVEKKINILPNGKAILLENIRFTAGEESNNLELAEDIARLFDIYVNDAFSCSHREHMSVHAIARFLPSYCGFLMHEELTNLELILNKPTPPLTAIIGGSKLSTKLEILENLIEKADNIFIGGAMANNFLKVQDIDIGNSLYEEEFLEVARNLLESSVKNKCKLILPIDGSVSVNINASADEIRYIEFGKDQIEENEALYDIGPKTVEALKEILHNSKSVIWNGPVGVFENENFAVSSIKISNEIARLTLKGHVKSVAGGGDVVAAIEKAGNIDDFTYISTAGGAFLEWISGKKLPGVEILKQPD